MRTLGGCGVVNLLLQMELKAEDEGFVYIFAFGENRGVAGALPGEQGSPGALHFIIRILILCQKINPKPLGLGLIFWQRMRDSNPRKRSQSPVCYRYTNPLYLYTNSQLNG